MGLEQLPVEGIDQCLDATPDLRREDAEFLADGFEEFDDRQPRVQYDGDIGIVRQLVLQQGAYECRLAGSHFTGQLHEAAAFGNAVDEVCERLAVAFTHEQVTRVGRYRERLFIEPEETRVHD